MKTGQGLCPCDRMKLAHDDLGGRKRRRGGGCRPPARHVKRSDGTRASLESLVCALEHEDGVGDLEGGAQLDAHDLHDVGLSQQQEGLAVNHLFQRNSKIREFSRTCYYYSVCNHEQ